MFFSYKLQIECMLLKEELTSNLDSLDPLIQIIKTAAKGKKAFLPSPVHGSDVNYYSGFVFFRDSN